MSDIRNSKSQMQGTRAHDEAETGTTAAGDGPVKCGGVATTAAIPAAVSNGNRVNSFHDERGRQMIGIAPAGSAKLTPASVSAASSGENTLVSATAAQVISVYRIFLVFAGAVDFKFKDAASGTDLTGAMSMKAGGSFVLDFDGEPWLQSASGGALILNLSSAVQVSGRLYYRKA